MSICLHRSQISQYIDFHINTCSTIFLGIQSIDRYIEHCVLLDFNINYPFADKTGSANPSKYEARVSAAVVLN